MAFSKRRLLLAAAIACCGPLHAQQAVYRCIDAAGKTSYKDAPCNAEGGNDRQQLVKLPANPPPPPVAASGAARPKSAYKAPVRASITLYYDPADEPMEHPTAEVEGIIRFATQAWMAGCNVDLQYAGKAPYRPDGTIERVSIRWRQDYMRVRHPSDPRAGVAGTGSMRTGIELTTRITDLKSTFVHELGHVLGLGHNHEDTSSVMSYLRGEAVRGRAQPSASDFLACNLSMKQMFGTDFAPEPGTEPPVPGRRMSDREALEKKLGRPQAPEGR
jgi:hypothetical protein